MTRRRMPPSFAHRPAHRPDEDPFAPDLDPDTLWEVLGRGGTRVVALTYRGNRTWRETPVPTEDIPLYWDDDDPPVRARIT